MFRTTFRRANTIRNHYSPIRLYGINKNLQKHDEIISPKDRDWDTALPFEKIPGPSKLSLITGLLPGGKFYNKSLREIHSICREEYGEILLFPGIFGKRDILITFNPDNFNKIFRTEGALPTRQGLDTLTYYRKNLRRDIFKDMGGLVAEQGEKWAQFRTVVNPVMMQTTAVKQYIPTIDTVAQDFIKRILEIRNSESNEMPSNFEDELNKWALESVGLVALDARLGLLTELETNPIAQKTIASLKTFFRLMYELDFMPSLWKIYATPKYKELMNAFDTMTEITGDYINLAKTRLETTNIGQDGASSEKSVLEKLLTVDPHIAHIMAMDLILAGVDTTSSGIVSCLFMLAKNPEQQAKLRDELKTKLPNKNSPITQQIMNTLPYLRACIKESFRLCPVSTSNYRTTGQDIVLSGYQIPKGTDIVMAAMILLTDEVYYTNSKEFIPERWLRTNRKDSSCPFTNTTHPFVFLPFGFGPRMCIGRRFAEVEMEVLLFRILRNFHVGWNYPEIKFKINVINVPSGELKFKLSDIVD